jgi:hypothetical protein
LPSILISFLNPVIKTSKVKWDRGKQNTHLVNFHPHLLATFFASLILTQQRLVTTTSNLGKCENSCNIISVTPNWNLRNKYFKHGNTFSSPFARRFQVRITSSSIIEFSLLEAEEPVILRDTRFGRVDREFKEGVGVEMVMMRVKDTR